MKVLADTSVWIDHLRRPLRDLTVLLDADTVIMHPAIIGELACGSLQNRSEILKSLAELPPAFCATDGEVLALIERRKLYSRGIGWVDAQLLTSAILSECEFWTLDSALSRAAAIVGLNAPTFQ